MPPGDLMRRQLGCVVPVWYPETMPADEMRGFLAACFPDADPQPPAPGGDFI